MFKAILRADGRIEKAEVGDGFQSWNKAIGARCGTIVQGRIVDTEKGCIRNIELWCDDEALCKADPEFNPFASVLANTELFGDVIVFEEGDIK